MRVTRTPGHAFDPENRPKPQVLAAKILWEGSSCWHLKQFLKLCSGTRRCTSGNSAPKNPGQCRIHSGDASTEACLYGSPTANG